MENKYGKTPQQRLEGALNQPSPTKNEIIAALPLSAALDRLRFELINNKEPGSFYHAFEANIANCILNELSFHEWGGRVNIPKQIMHDVAYNAAKRFLEALCSEEGEDIGWIKQSELQAQLHKIKQCNINKDDLLLP